jgi:hypothetical protein
MLAGIILPGKKVPEITTAQTIANSVVDAKKFDYLVKQQVIAIRWIVQINLLWK